jgi:VIT1/CCC1 family predicted Fe2+/Mn2+ transporter
VGVGTDLIAERNRFVDPVNRVSEIMFGLIMAVTIVGSLSIATAGRSEVRIVLMAALGCNLAWGLVDAVMHLVRTLTERTRNRSLAKQVVGASKEEAHRLIMATLPEHVAAITGPPELEGMRLRLLGPAVSQGALRRDDYIAAVGIFLLVVTATFPVVVPFLLTSNTALAMQSSRIITLAMLFAAGFTLGRYAGHAHPVRTGLVMLAFGAVLILAVIALGG